MLDVIIALLPATIAGVVIFGLRALFVVAVCVGVSILSEFAFNAIMKREQSVSDLSAIVTGLILALNLPANAPLWQAGVGAVLGFVPQILVLFLILAFLEACGYMSRIALSSSNPSFETCTTFTPSAFSISSHE